MAAAAIGFTIILVSLLLPCNNAASFTSKYVRPAEPAREIPISSFPPPSGLNAPEQVHITQGDMTGKAMIISWVLPSKRHPNVVWYWKADGTGSKMHVNSRIYSYRYFNYDSGYIHHALIKNLEYDTKYIYVVGARGVSRQFSFTTPPKPGPDVPYTFGIMGDLGQTRASNQTLSHYLSNPKPQTVLFAGDLSYADNHPNHNQVKWDTWGRFVEKSTAYQPWIWCAGNHELDFAPELGEYEEFKPYKTRYHTPYKSSHSTSPLWYSIKRASAHIIVLSSYSAYGKYTPQYQWLNNELPRVNRSETPWLIVVMHSPMYNTNNYHYMEGETMRVQFERWFVEYKVDVVIAGHVHSYERSHRVSNIGYNISNGLSTPVRDQNAPVYINIGDGGNIEGIANNFINPQPDYSAFREASFGHAILDIKNRTHAHYEWHRNQDDEVAVPADSAWFYNRYWYPHDEETK